MYNRLSEALKSAEEDEDLARIALDVMREPTAEVLAKGISPDSWRALVDAFLGGADEAEAKAFAQRIEAWRDTMVPVFEAAGCVVTCSNEEDHVWTIVGPGVDLTVDIQTAQVEGLSEGPYLQPFWQLTRIVPEEVAHKLELQANKARLAKRRETHDWDKAQLLWIPKNGKGPPIKGGS